MTTTHTHNTRTEWLDARRNGIGASDVASILGLSKWGSPWTVWRDRVDKPEHSEFDVSPMAEWGHRHEPAIAAKLVSVLEEPDVEVPWNKAIWDMEDPGDYTIYRADDPDWLTCTPDRLIVDGLTGNPLAVGEFKCAWYDSAHEWETQIPTPYRVQVQTQMHVVDVEWCVYGVLLNGWDFRWYLEKRNPKFMQATLKKLRTFWEDHVQTGIAPPPDWTGQTAQAIAAHYVSPASDAVVELGEEFEAMHHKRVALSANLAEKRKEKAAIDNAFKAAIGNAERGIITACGVEYTWRADVNGKRTLRVTAIKEIGDAQTH